MIVDALLRLLSFPVNVIISTLNLVPDPPDLSGGAGFLSSYSFSTSIAAQVIPFGGILALLGVVVVAAVAIQVLRIVMWVLAVFHVSGEEA